MKRLIQLEELFMFAACLYCYSYFKLSWWWFGACILLPDASMIGYMANNQIGAYLYNLFHHRGMAILVAFAGVITAVTFLQFAGYILFTHACLDRTLGYGLKYESGFLYTHLGKVGKDDAHKTIDQ
jgi:hypothetical protein